MCDCVIVCLGTWVDFFSVSTLHCIVSVIRFNARVSQKECILRSEGFCSETAVVLLTAIFVAHRVLDPAALLGNSGMVRL